MGQMIHAETIAPVFEVHSELAEKAKTLLSRIVRYWGPGERVYDLPPRETGSPSFNSDTWIMCDFTWK